jgi:hypothetical protein
MEAGKVIESVIILGGIGAMGYLLLKKKPTVEQEPTKKIFVNGKEITRKDYDEELIGLCSKSIGRVGGVQGAKWNTPSEALIKACLRTEEYTEVTEPLVAMSVVDLSSAPNDDSDLYKYGFSKHRKAYYTPSGELRANNCMELDYGIKVANSYLTDLYKLAGIGSDNKGLQKFYTQLIADLEAKFNKFNCRDRIEAVRTKSLVDLQSKGSIKAEESVLGKGFTEQKTYIILGALVLLTGFYVVVKK